VDIRGFFKENAVIDISDLMSFYQHKDQYVNPTTINWRIYTLVQKGVLHRIGRGKFVFGEAKKFIPEVSNVTKSIFNKLKLEFPVTNFCVWNTSVLNELMHHQSGNYFTLVETEREAAQSAFYYLREISDSVFIEPTRQILERYAFRKNNSIVIKTLTSESPTHDIDYVQSPTLEKILVDIFCDDVIFYAQQETEKRIIFREAFAKYTINQSKLMRYAARRGKSSELKQYMIEANKI